MTLQFPLFEVTIKYGCSKAAALARDVLFSKRNRFVAEDMCGSARFGLLRQGMSGRCLIGHRDDCATRPGEEAVSLS